ncbi:MAG: MaoC/PaaZ C-terminal domain-containing protein, partial [Salinisphaeraceae bacterium]|nr:MaoC/PaaZ C-terminal domain-containing protein [Salinisphaeraceae bacterium]
MPNNVTLSFSKPPNILASYAKALAARGSRFKPQEGDTIPRIEAKMEAVRPDRGNLTKYNEICGFTDPDNLPLTYPHILAASMHLEMLTNKAFPLPVMGLVHVRNSITQHRLIGVGEVLDIQVVVEGHRDLHNGVEFDLVSKARVADELVWEETTTILSRFKRKDIERPAKKEEAVIDYERSNQWDLPANLGRRYGIVAGDINPIHMGKLSAKLFGFPRAIAHGMWSLARATAELQPVLPEGRFTLDVAFRQPVLLPCTVEFKYS